jgi:hypothetical protein
MAIRDDAQRRHDQLFPNHESTLQVTDPELIDSRCISRIARNSSPGYPTSDIPACPH